MSEIKIPSVGRIVHYFPNQGDEVAAKNNAKFIPAIVVQQFGTKLLNLQVFTMNTDAPTVLRFSVNHKSDAPSGNGLSYWDWPEIV